MTIAIIAAMEEELEILREQIVDYRIEDHRGITFHFGCLFNQKIVLLKSGVGKVTSAAATTLLLNHHQVDAVINTGSIAALHPSLSIGDIVISTDVTYHDVDVTAFGYQIGQLPEGPVTFPANEDYQRLAIESVQKHRLTEKSGLICSGDTFVNNSEQRRQIRKNLPEAIAVDMESAAIGHVCWLFGVPFVVIRAVSDTANSQSATEFEKSLPTAAKRASLVVGTLISQYNHDRNKLPFRYYD